MPKAALPKDEKEVGGKHPNRHSVRVLLFNDVLVFASHGWKYITRIVVDDAHLVVKPHGECTWCVVNGLMAKKAHVMVCASPASRNEWVSQLTLAAFEGTRQQRKMLERKGTKKEVGAKGAASHKG